MNHDLQSPPAHSSGQSTTVNLTNCDREAIHIPGSVQPHGVLCVLSQPDLTILSISDNVAMFTQLSASAYVGQPLMCLLAADSVEQVRDALQQSDVARGNPYLLHLAHQDTDSIWNGILHDHEGVTILELEPHQDATSSYRECFDYVRSLTQSLQGTKSLVDACRVAVQEIRRMTGFESVLIYRFLPDAVGEVIVEDRDDSMPSYVGLHFPASDIPAQARALYTRNPSRNIPDVGYTPAPLMPPVHPQTGQSIDLSHAVLRSVSPIHLEYMQNMGVCASMSMSIIRDGRLWGLISCMDRRSRQTAYKVRQACELMAQSLAWQIGVLEEVEAVHHGMRVKALQAQLAMDIGTASNAHDALRRHGGALLEAVNATGAVLWAVGTLTTIGHTPPPDGIRCVLNWLVESHRGEVFHTERLPTLLSAVTAFAATASGLLAVPLSPSGEDMMLWFRPELRQVVQWGGNPNKAATSDAGDGRLHPRKSFAAWTEQVREQSRPWSRHEIVVAMEFRDLAVDGIVRRMEELERTNKVVQQASDQLETFVYVASHDLLEPARQVETLTEILQSIMPEATASDAEIVEVLDGIRGVSGRLRKLIGDLADFSKVGRQAEPLEPVDLDEILREALTDLSRHITEAKAQIVAESLPTVVCDRGQLRHVLLNLLSNALKFRDSAKPLVIRVYASADEAAAMPVDASLVSVTLPRPMVAICVQDNGIGFDTRHAEAIFEPFQRLHGTNSYEGSGVGLAICRKIVLRHGGAICAKGEVGVGSTFCFTLPARASYPANA